MIRNSVLSVALAASLFTGCSKKEPAGSQAESKMVEKTDKATPGSKLLTADVLGKKPAPFGPLTKVAFGQADADARKAAPEFFKRPDSKGDLIPSTEYADVNFSIGTDDKTHKVNRIYAQLPKSAVPLVTQAWGKGTDTKDSIDRPRTVWFDAVTGWRATLEAGYGEDMNLNFDRYLPATKLLGADKGDKLGFAPDGLLGATIDDLRTRFKDTLVEEDLATAEKNRADMNKMVGQDLGKDLGKAQPSVRLDLLPTEYESYWTRVNISWDDAGKVTRFYFKLPFEGYEPAKAELKKLIDDKLGTPKEVKEFGTTGDTLYVYHDKNPYLYVKEDTISHGWDVHYEVKKIGD